MPPGVSWGITAEWEIGSSGRITERDSGYPGQKCQEVRSLPLVLSLCVMRFYGRIASFFWASSPCLSSSRELCALEQRETGTRGSFPGLLWLVVQAVHYPTLGAPFKSKML